MHTKSKSEDSSYVKSICKITQMFIIIFYFIDTAIAVTNQILGSPAAKFRNIYNESKITSLRTFDAYFSAYFNSFNAFLHKLTVQIFFPISLAFLFGFPGCP